MVCIVCPHFVFALQNGRLVFEFPGNGGGEGVFVIAFCLCTALLLDCPLFRPSPTNLSYLPLSFSAKTLNRSSFPTCRRSGSREIFYYYYSHQNRQIRQHCCQFTSCICQNCLFFYQTRQRSSKCHIQNMLEKTKRHLTNLCHANMIQ